MFTAIWYPAVKRKEEGELERGQDILNKSLGRERKKIFTVWKCRQQNRVQKRRSRNQQVQNRLLLCVARNDSGGVARRVLKERKPYLLSECRTAIFLRLRLLVESHKSPAPVRTWGQGCRIKLRCCYRQTLHSQILLVTSLILATNQFFARHPLLRITLHIYKRGHLSPPHPTGWL